MQAGAGTEPGPMPTTAATESAQQGADPTPTPEQGTPPDLDYLGTVREISYEHGLDIDAITDDELLAAGQRACKTYDAGGDRHLGRAVTALDLPDGLAWDVHEVVALSAAAALCPDHWDRVSADE